jgi:hypothetical protein
MVRALVFVHLCWVEPVELLQKLEGEVFKQCQRLRFHDIEE